MFSEAQSSVVFLFGRSMEYPLVVLMVKFPAKCDLLRKTSFFSKKRLSASLFLKEESYVEISNIRWQVVCPSIKLMVQKWYRKPKV